MATKTMARKKIHSTFNPHPVDMHVGARVRLRRTMMGMSQEKLGEAVGLTFQQIQKYERGVNRMGASKLFEIGNALDVPVSFFFDDMPSASKPVAKAEKGEGDLNASRESLELMRDYTQLPKSVRDQLRHLLRAMNNEGVE